MSEVDPKACPAAHEVLVDEIQGVVEVLRGSTEPGPVGRELLNGLARDLFLLMEDAGRAGDGDDAAWLQPYFVLFDARLRLGPSVFPEQAALFDSARARLSTLGRQNQLLAQLRGELLGLAPRFCGEARQHLERFGVSAILEAPRLFLRAAGELAPELELAGRVLEALGLQAAFEGALGFAEPLAEARALGARLEQQLRDSGAVESRAEPGQEPGPAQLTTRGERRSESVAAGAILELVTPGFELSGRVLARPVVLLSAGRCSRVGAEAKRQLGALPEGRRRELEPVLRARVAELEVRLDEAEDRPADWAPIALELIAAVRTTGGDAEGLGCLIEALSCELSGHDFRLLLPAPGSPFVAGEGCVGRERYSADEEPGVTLRLLRPGLELDGEVIAPALVEWSGGPPPPGPVEEVLGALPDGAEGAHARSRLERARELAASDAGLRLGCELALIAESLACEELGPAACLALAQVLEESPTALLEAPGFESLREFLRGSLAALLEDGEEGLWAVLRLVRPYLQGLRTGSFEGARQRSLGEALSSILKLYDEGLAGEARRWVFAELERLGSGGLGEGGHARRMLRATARAISSFHENGEPLLALETGQALARAGVSVWPAEQRGLSTCEGAERLFHRLEARYDPAPRGAVLGSYEPAVTSAGARQVETGAVTLSLGPRPQLSELIAGEAFGASRLGAAAARLSSELTALDRARLIAELEGRSDAERLHVEAVGALVGGALEQSGWCRGGEERELFGRLFELLESELQVTCLPGYRSYRELMSLADEHGREAVAVTVERQGRHHVDIGCFGLLYRGALLSPLAMTWGLGAPPPYVAALRADLPWFDAVLRGERLEQQLPPRVREAIRDFESPDAGRFDGAVHSLQTIVSWLIAEQPAWLADFCRAVKEAPGLELDVFPLPGARYEATRILSALDESGAPGALSLEQDSDRQEGEALKVTRAAFYRAGSLVSEGPKACFSTRALPRDCEQLGQRLRPLFSSPKVPAGLASRLADQLMRLALLGSATELRRVELEMFRLLLEAELVDPCYSDHPREVLHAAGAWLAERLVGRGQLVVERFARARSLVELSSARAAEELEVVERFCRLGEPEVLEVSRPSVKLEGELLQQGRVVLGVSTEDEALLEYDRVLVDAERCLDSWRGDSGEPGSKLSELLDRALRRIAEQRKKNLAAGREGRAALPPESARRDLVRFVVDQVHRLEDALAIGKDAERRAAFGDQVFRDVVFRNAGPYLSKAFGISIDTAVVVGADTQALTGRFRVESGGPQPTRASKKVFSVVVPCYAQGGTTIRPAIVRVGDYS